MDFKRLIVVFTLTVGIEASGDWHWAYTGDSDPAHWGEHFPDCTGQNQSPINIQSGSVRYDASLAPLGYRHYGSRGGTYTLKNNGHSIQVDVKGGIQRISGGNLPGTYRLAQFHLHWGSSNSVGSEHLVDGQQYPMEVHFVHYNKKYKSLGEAADKPEGLAVIGAFFEIGGADHRDLKTIIDKLPDIPNKDDTINCPALFWTIPNLLPESPDREYFRYSGSLTTPGCYESVVWTVLKNTIKISQSQMDAFRSGLYQGNDTSHPLVNNYRPAQPLNSRVVYATVQ